MKLRGYREEDRGAVARVTATALGGSIEYWEGYYEPEKNPRLDPEQVYVVEEAGEIRATAAVLPLEVFLERRIVAMGGIAAVATHPASPSSDSVLPTLHPSHLPADPARGAVVAQGPRWRDAQVKLRICIVDGFNRP